MSEESRPTKRDTQGLFLCRGHKFRGLDSRFRCPIFNEEKEPESCCPVNFPTWEKCQDYCLGPVEFPTEKRDSH